MGTVCNSGDLEKTEGNREQNIGKKIHLKLW